MGGLDRIPRSDQRRDWSNLKVDLQITRVVKGENEYADGTQADVYTIKSTAVAAGVMKFR